ncbi:MAG: NAD-dependent epimerase/dehydratase family protein [Actinomycetota bacterium]
MKVVVTGGAGFIGANLCRILLEHPSVSNVVAVDDVSTGSSGNLAGVDVEFIEGTILDSAVLERSFRGADAVVHLAARPSVPRSLADPVATHTANATGTMSVLEAVRSSEVPSLVVASSSSVYGANPTLPKHEELATRPLSPYAASKLATEAYALAYQESFGVNTACFRFFNVFGPLQPAGHAYAAVIPAFISAALKGEPLRIFGDGRQSRDFTFVGTVGAVLCDAAVRRLAHPGPINLAFGSRVDLLTVVGLLEGIFGHPLEVVHEEARKGDVQHSQADQSLLRRLFRDVDPVDLETGLRTTVKWFKTLDPSRV